MNRLEVGDLVRLKEHHDEDHQIGVIVDISPKQAHLVSHGNTSVVRVYWPSIQETDWEYDFFLEKIDKKDLTEDK